MLYLVGNASFYLLHTFHRIKYTSNGYKKNYAYTANGKDRKEHNPARRPQVSHCHRGYKHALQPVTRQARAPQESPSQGTVQSSPTMKAPQETAEGPHHTVPIDESQEMMMISNLYIVNCYICIIVLLQLTFVRRRAKKD